ncbi:hypothetical protein AVEN_233571-1 [Araneus ventricosus]|uniref:Uncharacterized protein n=1 Tax=Araneus ventricosus TaxID=182803 RepID=A0A4Y2HPX6_ARAVE|nr:hypothetical protein AVEN_233571-1 [Araneus ventricosus]
MLASLYIRRSGRRGLGEGSMVRNQIPLQIRRILGQFHVKSYEGGQTCGTRARCGAGVWRGGASSGVALVAYNRPLLQFGPEKIIELADWLLP